MNCPNCFATNPENFSYCGSCGEPLTTLAAANERKKESREKKALEIELTEAVAKRFVTWSRWILGVATVLFVGAGFLVGKEFFDLHKAIASGRQEVSTSVSKGVSDISGAVSDVKKSLNPTISEITGIKQDADKYKDVNRKILDLQNKVGKSVPNVIDLSTSTLKVGKLVAAGKGPAAGTFFTSCGDLTLAKGALGSICFDGQPLTLNMITLGGTKRPVGSLSDRGFQDLSGMMRPSCDDQTRGTFFVDKGRNGQGDKAIVCLRADRGAYSWHEFATSN